MNRRLDLMHLSTEALAHTVNAGVVKRAVRELEGGYSPQWILDDANTLIASFSDGIVATWPEGKPIQQALCSCGAVSVCRHRIIAALAFRAASEATADTPLVTTSPGLASDQDLEKLVPQTVRDLARRELGQGLSVEIRRRAAGEACDTARLPSATVRFWAGASIEAARCDCVRAVACEHVVLAVWAFRKADTEQPDSPACQVRLGSSGASTTIDHTPYHRLTEVLLQHGVTHGAAPLAQAFSGAFQAARDQGTIWLDHLLADLEHWAQAYSALSASYDPQIGVSLLAELALRLHAGGLPGNSRSVLGIGQPGATELDRLRLVCLGARTQRDVDLRRTRLIMADIDSGTRLVLVKEWNVPANGTAQEAELRAAERLAPGLRMEQLAQGQLLAQQARRHPDGTLQLAKARSAQNSVLPQSAEWGTLGAPLRFSEVSELIAQKRAHPTAQLLPRHAAGQFVVFSPQRVEWIGYDPNVQALVALVSDKQGHGVIVRRHYEAHVRHALDALAGAFIGHYGPLHHIAGLLNWEHGKPVIEPWAMACDSVNVPDFATACGALAKVELCNLAGETGSPLTNAMQGVKQALSTLLHHGVKELPGSWLRESATLIARLKMLGLHALAQCLTALCETIPPAQARPGQIQVAEPLLQLLALMQLHDDAQVVCAMDDEEPISN